MSEVVLPEHDLTWVYEVCPYCELQSWKPISYPAELRCTKRNHKNCKDFKKMQQDGYH